jgi:hypothetical protein
MSFKKFLPALAALSLLGYLAVLVISKNLPIYPDEPDWKMTQTRLLIDNFKLIYLFPFCTESYIQNVPWTWIPTRVIESFIFQDLTHIQKLRYIGILGFVLWTLIAGTILLSPLKDKFTFWIRQTLLWSILSIGLLPLLLTFSRPEQLVLLYLSILLFIWLYRERQSTNPRSLGAELSLGFLLLFFCLATLSVHPKAVYFIPVMLIVLHRSLRHIGIKLVMISVVLFSGYETFNLWNARVSCPESPKHQSFLQTLSIHPSLAITAPRTFWEQGSSNFKSSGIYWDYIKYSNKEYQSQWLPNPPFPPGIIDQFLDWWPIPFAIFGIFIFCILWGRKLWRERALDVRSRYELLVCLSLLGFVFCDFWFQNIKNFYEIGIIWPILVISFFVGARSILTEINQKIVYILTGVIFVTALLNSYSILSRYYNGWRENWLTVKYANNSSLVKVNMLAKKCGLDPKSSVRLVLDAQSYPVFSVSKLPVMNSYLFGYYSFEQDYHVPIEKLGLTYFIGACSNVPKEFAAHAIFSEDQLYCCTNLRSNSAVSK